VDVHTVVVVTGAVVGATYTVVGVVVRTVVDVDPREGFVVVVVGRVVVVVVEVTVVVGVVVGVATTLGAFAAIPTRTADVAAEPITINWVMRRTRAKRLSRCWGVRCLGVIRFS